MNSNNNVFCICSNNSVLLFCNNTIEKQDSCNIYNISLKNNSNNNEMKKGHLLDVLGSQRNNNNHKSITVYDNNNNINNKRKFAIISDNNNSNNSKEEAGGEEGIKQRYLAHILAEAETDAETPPGERVKKQSDFIVNMFCAGEAVAVSDSSGK